MHSCCKYLIHNSWMKSSPNIVFIFWFTKKYIMLWMLNEQTMYRVDVISKRLCTSPSNSLVHNSLWFTIWFSVLSSWLDWIGTAGQIRLQSDRPCFFTKPQLTGMLLSLSCEFPAMQIPDRKGWKIMWKLGRRKWLTSVCRINRFLNGSGPGKS